MTSIFPLIKIFADIKTSSSTVMLTEEIIIHDKCFRCGTIFSILGWREINEIPYLILSKGSWEGLVNYHDFLPILEKIK
jgi:hypothetical protein